MITRRFEYVGNGSDKFWEITYPDMHVDRGVRSYTCRWGRRGTTGQSKNFTARDQYAAIASAEDKIAGKMYKGYREVLTRSTGREQDVTRQRITQTVSYIKPQRQRRRSTGAVAYTNHPATNTSLTGGETIGETKKRRYDL